MKDWWVKKWFKGMTKWLVYYAVWCVLTYIAIRVFEEQLVEEITSLVPLAAIASMLGYAIYIRVLDNLYGSIGSMKFSKDGGHAALSFRSPKTFDNGAKRFTEALFLLCAPLPLPFIYFFPANVKLIATGICAALPLCVLTLVFFIIFIPRTVKGMRQNRRNNIAYKKRKIEEMKKQKEKESLGEWRS